jgi:excinuclease ABC subunit A
MKGVIQLNSIYLPPKKFNPKRPGALVGTITEVSEYLGFLHEKIGKGCDDSRLRTSRDFSETPPSPNGECSACHGTGTVTDITPDRMIAPELSLKKGAVLFWAGSTCKEVSMIKQLAKMIGIDYEKPLAEQDKRFIDILLFGYDKEPVSYVHKKKQWKGFYRGCVFDLRSMRDAGTVSQGNLRAIGFFSGTVNCPQCNGSKPLDAEGPKITTQGRINVEASTMSISELLQHIQNLPASLNEQQLQAAEPWIDEIELRLIYLNKMGLKTLSPSTNAMI